jgi:uncharacterized protein
VTVPAEKPKLDAPRSCRFPRRALAPPRRTTGLERRWLDPYRGVLKLTERTADRIVSRYVYPHLLGIWHPYCWQLPRRFSIAEAVLEPPRWPDGAGELRVLLLSDVHTGAFLKPAVLESLFAELMRLEPDLVAVAGDVIEGSLADLDGFLPALSLLSDAPLGAWYCHGNHDYYSGETKKIRDQLASVGLRTLRNESVRLAHGSGAFVLGGIDDRILGTPDWGALADAHGAPDLLLAHNPDDLYEAATRGIALVLSGHTHGGQIRLPNGPPIVRQSQFCLDEGLYVHEETVLAVSRGVGAVGIPWRIGADPEAIWLRVRAPASRRA